MLEDGMQLVIRLIDGPYYVSSVGATQQETSAWLLKLMEEDGLAVFQDKDGNVIGAVRANRIQGFGYEQGPDPEWMDLCRRKLKAEVEHMEHSLKSMNEGNEWKNGH